MEKQQFECMTLCPLDGRYAGIKEALGEYFSEYALTKYRVYVEVQWLKFLIETMDDAILARFDRADMPKIEAIAKHYEWAEKIKANNEITEENCERILQNEIGKVFAEILEQCGVFKRNAIGKSQFLKFIEAVNN